jgi:hypothetical protein
MAAECQTREEEDRNGARSGVFSRRGIEDSVAAPSSAGRFATADARIRRARRSKEASGVLCQVAGERFTFGLIW